MEWCGRPQFCAFAANEERVAWEGPRSKDEGSLVQMGCSFAHRAMRLNFFMLLELPQQGVDGFYPSGGLRK